MLVVLYAADTYAAHVVQCGTQSYGIGHIGSAGLKTGGRHVVLGTLYGYVLYHVAASLPGLHLVQQLLTAVDHAYAVGAVYLMA